MTLTAIPFVGLLLLLAAAALFLFPPTRPVARHLLGAGLALLLGGIMLAIAAVWAMN